MEEKFWEYEMWSHQTGCWTLGEQREENDDDDKKKRIASDILVDLKST